MRRQSSTSESGPKAKQPKLDVSPDAQNQQEQRIPDDLLLHIFRLNSDVRQRMRLCLVSKRFRTLVYSKALWTDVKSLSVELNGLTLGSRTATINGHTFNTKKRTAAIELLLACCGSIDRLQIVIDPDCRDVRWLKVLVRRIANAQASSGGKWELKELNFSGTTRYIPSVMEALVAKNGTPQSITIRIHRETKINLRSKWQSVRSIFTQLASCVGLRALTIECLDLSFRQSNMKIFVESAVAALSGKANLERLVLQLLDSDWADQLGHAKIAAVANSCPSLLALRCAGPKDIVDTGSMLNLLNEETLHRLQEVDLSFGQHVSPLVLNSLPLQFPNLTHSVVRLFAETNLVVGLLKSFLGCWQMEAAPKFLTLDFRWRGSPFSNLADVFTQLQPFYDSLAMAQGGRVAFLSGSVVVACRF